MRFDGDIIITDPCYVAKDNDWDHVFNETNLKKLGFTNYIWESTIYGDWSCTTVRINPDNSKEKIGKFCADAGLVGVFLLSEVLKYNPEYNYIINQIYKSNHAIKYQTINLNYTTAFNTQTDYVFSISKIKFCQTIKWPYSLHLPIICCI